MLGFMKRAIPILFLTFVASLSSAQERVSDQIYMKEGGAAFTLDVFKASNANAPCVIWLCSGGWFSNHTDINPVLAKMFNDQGITLIEVVHGSQPRYTLKEIVPQIKRAVRYVHANATRFGIDEKRIGISGGSAGGHLSLMIGGTGDAGNPDAKDLVEKSPSTVNAVGVFMPPTDFLNWGKADYMPFDSLQMAVFMPAFGITKESPKDKILQIGKVMSPIGYVTAKFPQTLIIHGDKDGLVPVQQAKVMDESLGKSGVDHTLIIVEGGGHDAKTFNEGFPKLLAWFKSRLK